VIIPRGSRRGADPKFSVFSPNSRYSGLTIQGCEQAIASERISGLGALNGSAFAH
jgi:hypothetical protein